MLDLSSLPTQPPGFGRCAACPYRETAPPALCFSCARKSIETLSLKRCMTCDLPIEAGRDVCGNPICGWSDRWFVRNYAIAMRSGPLQEAISDYKYEGVKAWAQIFARVLVGFLDSERDTFRRFQLIVASPSFITQDGTSRNWDHTKEVIRLAYEFSEERWPFDIQDPAAIIKSKKTTPMVQARTWKGRHDIAQTELRDALKIPKPSRIKGKRVLVYDDVFTDGQTLNEVARRLRLEGATEVCGVTLARQRFGGRPGAS